MDDPGQPPRKHLIPKFPTYSAWVVGLAAVAGAVVVGLAEPGTGQEPGRRPHALAVDGHRYAEWSAEAQLAFLQGFLSGAAAAQAAEAAGGPRSELDSLTAELAGLGVARRLHFPFAPTVYQARLQDYYFYRDRRDRSVAAALLELNRRLLTDHF